MSTTKPTTTKPATARKPKATAAKPKPDTPTAKGFIDRDLMDRAIALRKQGKTMKAIGEELNVKATAYLAKKIKQTYGPDALAPPANEA